MFNFLKSVGYYVISAIRLYLQTICVRGEKIGAGHKAERMVNQNCVVYLF